MDNYNDIINMPHHTSKTRSQMSMANRAAQFSPFAALIGFESAIKETARLTDSQIELDEYEKEEINSKIQLIAERIGDDFEVVITYFLHDLKKDGGSYVSVQGIVKKIDIYERMIVFFSGEKIPIADIFKIAFTD